VGTISVTAFDDEASAPPTVAAPASLAGQRSAADIAAVSTLERGVRIDSVAANGTPQQLREALVRGSIDSTCRGLIVEGNTTEKRNLDLIEFKPLPIPAMVGVVSYYEPSGKSGQ
jgi:predicted methyltransferase MtxX (methanogen marker protein 4)